MSKCHQRIIREQLQEPAPPIALTKDSAIVRPIIRAEAEAVILKYEWLGTMPASVTLAVGMFFGSHLAGVEVFTSGKAGSNYQFCHHPAICLSRGAGVSWAPSWCGSFLIRKALALVDSNSYNFCLAYSDTEAGEIGTIYQASGWVCTGTTPNSYWLDPNGKRYDRCLHRNRARQYENGRLLPVTRHNEVRADLERQGWRLVRHGATRWRYAEANGRGRAYRERRKFLETLAVPFPKRIKCQ